ncbi:hypothetical protein [Paraburkholderia sp.]|uniref:hypothetical protein n=1 Tax=Paraburkholderia sp. TaxID=1926495 RepID=UPI002388D6D7|nr:hypothetical protein [Paraburkholderia sp.]MDE1179475.1 hypothetical protein [Paraburkholderia sp.]
MFLMNGDEPLDASLRMTILTTVHASAASLARGSGDKESWNVIVNALNIALVLSEDAGNNALGLEVVYAGQNAMIAVAERFHRTERLVFAGGELQALNSALALFEQMVDTVTKRQYTRAAGETVRRKNAGDVVRIRKEGTTKRFELVEVA